MRKSIVVVLCLLIGFTCLAQKKKKKRTGKVETQSLFANALYRQCTNYLTVVYTGKDSVVYEVKGGELIKGKDNIVNIVPDKNCSRVRLLGLENQDTILNQLFLVIDVPTPYIAIISKGRPINLKNGVFPPRSVTINTEISDNFFKQNYPRDSRYMVSRGQVTLIRGNEILATIQIKGKRVSLGKIASIAKPGDRMLFEFSLAKRRKSSGGYESIKLRGSQYVINVPIKF